MAVQSSVLATSSFSSMHQKVLLAIISVSIAMEMCHRVVALNNPLFASSSHRWPTVGTFFIFRALKCLQWILFQLFYGVSGLSSSD